MVETERRTTAAVALLVDLSFSMELRGTWGAAKQTALALHSLVTTQFPQDAIEVIGFSDLAQVLRPEQLAGLDAQRVQGTNLQHALMLAGRFLGKHPDAEPVVLVVTDGEPTAHLTRGGWADFSWPPLPETLALTMAEVERITRRGATINVFMLDDEPRLVDFVNVDRGPQRRPRVLSRPLPPRRVRRLRLPAGPARPPRLTPPPPTRPRRSAVGAVAPLGRLRLARVAVPRPISPAVPPDGGGEEERDMDVLRRIRNGSAVAVTVGLLVTVVGAGVKFG